MIDYLKKLSLTIFANNFVTMLLGIFPHEIGKKEPFSHWDWSRYSPPKRSRKFTAPSC
jgi:hypothetical protein